MSYSSDAPLLTSETTVFVEIALDFIAVSGLLLWLAILCWRFFSRLFVVKEEGKATIFDDAVAASIRLNRNDLEMGIQHNDDQSSATPISEFEIKTSLLYSIIIGLTTYCKYASLLPILLSPFQAVNQDSGIGLANCAFETSPVDENTLVLETISLPFSDDDVSCITLVSEYETESSPTLTDKIISFDFDSDVLAASLSTPIAPCPFEIEDLVQHYGREKNTYAFASSLDVLVQDLQLEKGGREHEHVATSLIDPVETATLEKIVYDNEGANDVVETENSASSLDVTTLVKRQMNGNDKNTKSGIFAAPCFKLSLALDPKDVKMRKATEQDLFSFPALTAQHIQKNEKEDEFASATSVIVPETKETTCELMVLYDVAAAFSARRAKEMFGTTIYSGSFYESIYSCEWLAFLVMADLARNWAIHRNVSLASATMALQIFEQEILVKDAFDYLAISQKFADAVCEFKHQSLVAGDYTPIRLNQTGIADTPSILPSSLSVAIYPAQMLRPALIYDVICTETPIEAVQPRSCWSEFIFESCVESCVLMREEFGGLELSSV